MLRLVLVGAVLLVAVPVAPAAGDVFNGRIAFTSARDGGDFDIFTMTPAGEDLRLLTSNTRNDHQPDWHPSGTALAFRAEVARRFQVWRMGAEGEDQREIVALTRRARPRSRRGSPIAPGCSCAAAGEAPSTSSTGPCSGPAQAGRTRRSSSRSAVVSSIRAGRRR